jgi:hypothetical protein
MAQHDYIIANQSGAAFRSDLNNGLAAIVSNNSGAAQPSTTYAYQWWSDTTTGLLKLRNAANNAWITIGTLASANLGLLALGGGTLTGALLLDDAANTAAAPALAFDGDTNTGIFRSAADTLNVATNGVENLEFGTTEVVFNDGGADIDFRIEGDTKANLFKVDAGTDKVVIDGITQPSADGTADQSIVTNGSGVLSFATRGRIILDTTKPATGTSVDFTSIPSWAKSITVAFAGVSTDGTDDYLIQLGDAGGIETTGYLGAAAVVGVSAANYTAGFGIISNAIANIHHGAITLTAMGANMWVAAGTLARSNQTIAIVTAGSKTLSDTLTQVRITTVNGTNGFDAGDFNILYNG